MSDGLISKLTVGGGLSFARLHYTGQLYRQSARSGNDNKNSSING